MSSAPITRRLNARFGTTYAEFEPTEENVARCLREIDEDWRARRGDGDRLERVIPRPSPAREGPKTELRERYDAEAPPNPRRWAEQLYAWLHPDRGRGALVSSVIFGVRLDELASVEQLRGVATGYASSTATARSESSRRTPRSSSTPTRTRATRTSCGRPTSRSPTGRGVAIVQTLRNGRSVRRWPGVEIAALLLRLAAERGETVAFVGGTPDVAERAAARWRALPGLKVVTAGAGAHDRRGRPRPPRRA